MLQIYDGDTSAYPLMVLTGREKTQIKSQSQNLLLVFKTGRQNHGNPGFNATYQFIQGKRLMKHALWILIKNVHYIIAVKAFL